MANLLARGRITIAAVSDGYTLSLSAASLSMTANHDGTNADLLNAYTLVTISKGGIDQSFKVINVIPSSDGISYTYHSLSETKWKVAITGVEPNITSGYLDILLSTTDGYQTSARLTFTIVRNTAGIEWIEEWDGTHSQLGENYVITPKLFAGHKTSDGKITGIYLGKLKGFIGEVFPFALSDPEEGIYGYRDNKIVFYISNNGASIGGWDITPKTIQCQDGTLTIKSEGAISSQSNGVTHWTLNKDGSASFANGNVRFMSNGDADFEGKITSSSGHIGGWRISANQLNSNHVIIDSAKKIIGISAEDLHSQSLASGDYTFPLNPTNGIKMWCNSMVDFGLAGWNNSKKIFQFGSQNLIACWNFDTDAMWIGEKNNTPNDYTKNAGDITIGHNGLRGNSWFINSNGTTSFANGLVKFDLGFGNIANWSIADSRLATNNMAIFADGVSQGIYLTAWKNAEFITSGSDEMETIVSNNGGIYLITYESNAVFSAYDSGGMCLFSLNGDETSMIAGWNFNDEAIWCGIMKNTGFTSTGHITISQYGLRGHKWRFENNGSGGIAGDKIKWDSNGNVTIDSSVKIGWNNLGGTIIDSNGIFTGKIKADNITAGTISTASIVCANKWMLNQDGSGYLANKNITWDAFGNVKVQGEIVATSGTIGSIQIYQDHIGVTHDGNISLSIYKDFFMVGSNNGYVRFKDNLFSGTSSGGLFTAVGEIVNSHQNKGISGATTTVNYGLKLNVSGADKNYGVQSNASCIAPAFVPTRAKILTWTDTSKPPLDFSENNILLVSYTSSQYASFEVSMPSEDAVANKFGERFLPNDFATIVTIRVRPGSKTIVLKNIYNHDEALTNYTLKSGDSVMLLVSKIDGFRYQILNYTSNA